MKRTQLLTLATLFIAGGVVNYLALQLLFRTGHTMPRLPWSSALSLLLLAMVLFITAFNVNRRLEERRKGEERKSPSRHRPTDPLFLARLVLLAKSAAHGGALLGGVYAGFCATYLVVLGHLANSSLIWNSIIDAVAALLVSIGGYVLERVLTIKDDGNPN